jgi:hypothetical protein
MTAAEPLPPINGTEHRRVLSLEPLGIVIVDYVQLLTTVQGRPRSTRGG